MYRIILLILLAGCAHQDEWTKRDTIMQVGVTAMIIGDAILTTRIKDHPNVYECGPIAKQFLGRQPKTQDVYLYMGTLIVTNYLISRALPAKWRPYWQAANMVQFSYMIYNNCQHDLC